MALFALGALSADVRALLAHRDRLLRVERAGAAALDGKRAEDGADAGGADAGGPTVEEHLRGRRLEAVAAHPEAPDRAFVGTFDEGCFVTRDGGRSFEPIDVAGPDEFASDDDAPAITALAVDPADPDVVWVGTEPSRLYRSTDAGRSFERVRGLLDVPSAGEWSFPPRPHTHHVRWIEPDPTDPERLYVGVEAGALVYTTDGGDSWHDRPPGARRDNHQLATHSDAPGRVYSAAGDGYAVSDDGGESWTSPQAGLEHRYVWNVLPDPGDPDRVLVSAARGASSAHSLPGESYLYRRDGDAEWRRLDGPCSGEGVLRAVLATDGEPGRAYAATNRGLYVSRDFGDSWTAVDVAWPDELTEQTARGLVVLPT